MRTCVVGKEDSNKEDGGMLLQIDRSPVRQDRGGEAAAEAQRDAEVGVGGALLCASTQAYRGAIRS